MRITSWLRKLVGAGRRAPCLPVRCRPRLEALEDRLVLSFVPAVYYSTPSTTEAMAVGDFTGSGKDDIVLFSDEYSTSYDYLLGTYSTTVTGRISLLLNNGDGTFKAGGGVTIPGGVNSGAVGDLDHDGNLDIAVANTMSTSAYGWLQPCQIMCAEPPPPWPFGFGATQGEVSILLGNGDGTFQDPTHIPLLGAVAAGGIVVSDFDGDTNPDIAVGSQGPLGGQVNVLQGTGTGMFVPADSYATISDPSWLAVGNLNGKPSLAVTNGSTNVDVLLSAGNGQFLPQTTYSLAGYARSVTISDFNNDGSPDLALDVRSLSAGIPNHVAVMLNNADGTFQSPSAFGSFGLLSQVAAADFNQDGKQDLVAADSYSFFGVSGVRVLLGNGDGSFQLPLQFANYSTPFAVSVGNFNGDKSPDLATLSSSFVSVLINDGTWPPVVRISDVIKAEGNQGKLAFTFTVTLSYASAETITLNYTTVDGDAQAGKDYQAASGTLTFNPGETTQTITVWVLGDKTPEYDEFFYVDLFNVLNADIEDGRGVGVIRNDDNGR